MLARDARDILVADVFRLFVFQPDASEVPPDDDALRAALERAASCLDLALAGSVADLGKLDQIEGGGLFQ
jgi:hypothetical protein